MKAHELLSTPDKWTQGAFARDINNLAVRENSERACKWCAAGAIVRCYPENEQISLLLKLGARVNLSTITTWNDNSCYEVIIKVLKELDI